MEMKNLNVAATRRETRVLDYKTVKLDITARLQNTCADWSRDDFEALVEKVTLTTLKFPPPRLLLSD
jgi:hypothetical protein